MRCLILPVLFLVSFSGFTQDSSFQIKNYKYRTPGFRALAASFNLSGSYNEANPGSSDERSNRHISLGPAIVSYTRLISTDKRLHESAINTSAFGSSSKTVVDQKQSRNNFFLPKFSWYRNDRFYKTNQWFFEVGNQISIGYKSQQFQDTTSDYQTSSRSVFNKLTVGVGKGRIERVQDAQMALYILQDLSAQGLLNIPVSAETANEFAVLITDINNRRIFDFRRRRIYELTRIDTFLRNSGLTGQTDIRHFTTINDNWALAFNPYRLSGDSWYVRFQPSLLFSQGSSKYLKPVQWPTTRNEASTLDLAPVVGYENYKPVNLQWQRNYGSSVSYKKTRTLQQTTFNNGGTIDKLNRDDSDWWTEFNIFYGVGFFPNNRTQINALLRTDVAFSRNKQKYLQPAFNLDANYFISYRTYLSASANIGYTYSEWLTNAALKHSTGNFYSAMSVTLSHVLF